MEWMVSVDGTITAKALGRKGGTEVTKVPQKGRLSRIF